MIADSFDTIAAIATSVGEAGIGIVRLSGQDALSIAGKVFLAKDGRKPSDFKTYTVHYGWIVDRQGSGVRGQGSKQEDTRPKTQNPRPNIIDEVLLTVMRAPRSYTKEDVVEINCHGGIVPLRRVMDLILRCGARLAEPGEFTKRAFLNGRIDLAQAEAVLEIIRAKSEAALTAGLQQLRGALSEEIEKIRNALLEILTGLEAGIDFPDEEIAPAELEIISGKLKQMNSRLQSILDNARYGRILREGLHAVICGRPNVGKSSLLNALLRQERSIVTATPGTTRDTIEELIDLKGIPVRVVDTAGILKPRDLIEKKAVERSRRYIDLADLVILLFDGSREFTADDRSLARRLKGKTVLAVVNKIDKKQKLKREEILKIFPRLVEISARKNQNIELLEQAICELVYAGRLKPSEPVLVTNLRHIQAVRKAQKLIAEALNSLDNEVGAEFVSQSLKDAAGFLDELLGKRFSEDLLERIFSDFCVGK